MKAIRCIRPLISPTQTASNQRSFATGTRGSRGHGWLENYRAGKGGRHLQGDYHDRPSLEERIAWNKKVLDLGSQRVYLDIKVGPAIDTDIKDTDYLGMSGETFRLEADLARATLEQTTDNFTSLCSEEAFNGSLFYRIEPKAGICAGDYVTNTGRTGKAFGAVISRNVKSDPLVLWHHPGTISMIVASVDEIDSRFMLCTADSPHMDGIHRAFGLLTPESLDLVSTWHSTTLTRKGRPASATYVIVGSGVETSSEPVAA